MGTVESRRKTSGASSAAAIQQEWSDKRPPVAHRRPMSCVGGISLITDRILYGLFHTFIRIPQPSGHHYHTSGSPWPSTSSFPLTLRFKEPLKTVPLCLPLSIIALTYPRGFVTYCTISNTVKAIGIGGSASLFLSAKFTSEEADARNLVVLLPPATQFVASPLHSLLTQCAFRHGIFNVGAEDLDIEALATFISQPDTTQEANLQFIPQHHGYTHTHQISTSAPWDPLPLCLALTFNSQISYFYYHYIITYPRAWVFTAA